MLTEKKSFKDTKHLLILITKNYMNSDSNNLFTHLAFYNVN